MPEEIIQIEHEPPDLLNIKEERKANGRLVAVIVALFLLFLAIYHAWIRKIAVLAGVLIPALIMILYAGWVVFLAKRDKQRRILLARQIEETTRRELSESKSTLYSTNATNATKLLINNKINPLLSSLPPKSPPSASSSSFSQATSNASSNSTSAINKTRNINHNQNNEKRRKRMKHKNHKDITTITSSSHISKKWRDKKLSFRHRIFRQNAQTEALLMNYRNDSIRNSLSRSFSMP